MNWTILWHIDLISHDGFVHFLLVDGCIFFYDRLLVPESSTFLWCIVKQYQWVTACFCGKQTDISSFVIPTVRLSQLTFSWIHLFQRTLLLYHSQYRNLCGNYFIQSFVWVFLRYGYNNRRIFTSHDSDNKRTNIVTIINNSCYFSQANFTL